MFQCWPLIFIPVFCYLMWRVVFVTDYYLAGTMMADTYYNICWLFSIRPVMTDQNTFIRIDHWLGDGRMQYYNDIGNIGMWRSRNLLCYLIPVVTFWLTLTYWRIVGKYSKPFHWLFPEMTYDYLLCSIGDYIIQIIVNFIIDWYKYIVVLSSWYFVVLQWWCVSGNWCSWYSLLSQ